MLRLVFLIFVPIAGANRAFKNFDYCSIKCEDGTHPACDCSQQPPRKEILEDPPLVEFRKKILHEHNYWRNVVASGKETRPPPDGCPTASNMMLMNYDLECEHVARCRAINSFRHSESDATGHDKCRRSMVDKRMGQNLYGSSKYNATKFLGLGNHWYKEVEDMPPGYTDNYTGTVKGIGHFTQMIWWSANKVGCVRVFNSDNKRSWKNTLICNYFSTIAYSGNLKYSEIYKQGEICNACPDETKCDPNGDYPALCGTPEPVPEDGVTTGASQFKGEKTLFMVAALSFYMYIKCL